MRRSAGTVMMWDLATGVCVRTLNGHTSSVYSLALLPDGRLASASGDKTVKLWDVSTGSCVGTLSGHTGAVRALASLPDGRIACSAFEETIHLLCLD